MPSYNPSNLRLEKIAEQERLSREDMIFRLSEKKDFAARLGNDNGETSKIEELITQFKEGKISGEKALGEADKIIHGKEAGIDATSGGH
jgi:hypothetical protein